jgi:hypothetical protein
MPVLASEQPASPSRRTASAYPQIHNPRLASVVLGLALLFLVRNIFFHDYRRDEIQHLLASGKSKDEIRNFVPPTLRERREEALESKNELERLKADVLVLKQQMHELVERLEETDEHKQSRHRSDRRSEIKMMPEIDSSDAPGQSLDRIRFQEEEEEEKGSARDASRMQSR